MGNMKIRHDKIIKMKTDNRFKYTGALVLGMHDALVEISGIIAGLTFAIADRKIIIMTGAIAAVAASLSMAAANYQAQRADENPYALTAALYTGAMYIGTSAALIFPFALIQNRFWALGMMGLIAVLIIFGFNCAVGHAMNRPFMKRFGEMLIICTGVSVASFIIGMLAKYFMGVQI
ncbi:MAG: VIT1/CCC1 transporter family protein [Alphaproteobacteria bacterium]|nr:VIT1/CCC1 transporter family protein [Alphaproteobacteria bacterium]